MRSIYIILFISWTLSGQAQFIDKPFNQLIKKERRAALKRLLKQPLANTDNYDVKFYRLNLSPSMITRDLSGEVTTYFEALQNLSTIEFDFTDQMAVNSIVWHGQNLSFSQNNNVLTVNLPQNIPSGTLDSLSILYSGQVPNTGLDSYTVTTHGNNVPVVWTLSEPYGAKDWWPCKQDLTDKADSVDVIIHYQQTYNNEEMVAVSNGLKTSETNITGQIPMKVTAWKHRYPIAAYLVAFAVTNYSKFSETAGVSQTFPIDNYVYPENLSDAQAQSSHFVPVMTFFENTYGPYPFNAEKYGQIQFGWGGGMEHQTATFVINYQRWLTAHELAHQWFGDAVTCGSWHDIWLNEGFATYSEALVREHFDGQQAFDDWKASVNSDIISQPGGSVYVQDTTDVWRIFDGRLSYHKGAMVLNMLRLKVGDTNFFQGLRNYLNHYKFSFAKPPDFIAEMNSESGQDLQEFFNDWVYGQGYPTYNITVTRTGAGQYDVEVSQTTSHPSVDFFEMPLPFKFTGNNNQSYEIMLNNITNNQLFTFNTGFEATDVFFDPHNDIVKGPTTLNQVLTIDILEASTIRIFPNPAQSFLKITADNDQIIQKVNLMTLDGKSVGQFETGFDQIPLKDLPQGLYLVKINMSNQTIIKKLIKN
jgi:aminopeptidase N